MTRKLKLLSASFIMALTLAAPFATYAMEPEEDHKAVTKKATYVLNYLAKELILAAPILKAIYHHTPELHPDQYAYHRFLTGKLIYKPDPNSDKGMVVMPIADLLNPLDGKFDLSECGDADKFLSINTGYRKGKRPGNTNKLEIWFAPRFLIETNLAGSASHFERIMGSWDARTAPVGTFFTLEGWDNLEWYDYATQLTLESYNDPENNLKTICRQHTPLNYSDSLAYQSIPPWRKFSCHFLSH